MICTIDDVIDALGGTAAVAERLGLPLSTVSSWRARGSIPAEYWRGLLRADGSVTLETLADVHWRGVRETQP